MQIQIDKLVRAKRRTIALIIEQDGSLTVRAPKRAALGLIEQFIHEKADWIVRTQEKFKSMARLPKKQFVDGEKFLFLGQEYELLLVKPQRPALRFEDGFFLGATAQPRARQVLTRWYRQKALDIFSERVALHARLHGFEPGQVKVTAARTRWGSCSSNGTLNFSWRLVMAPIDIIDYVVIHELVHLKIKNHSQTFWAAVERLLPEYRSKRKWLREKGEALNL